MEPSPISGILVWQLPYNAQQYCRDVSGTLDALFLGVFQPLQIALHLFSTLLKLYQKYKISFFVHKTFLNFWPKTSSKPVLWVCSVQLCIPTV